MLLTPTFLGIPLEIHLQNILKLNIVTIMIEMRKAI